MTERAGIVIPLDGSRTAAKAMGAAQSMAGMLDAVLHILHVSDQIVPEQELLEKLGVENLERDFVLHQVPGDVVDAVIDLASREDTRLVVMSSHGVTYDSGALMGHIAMEIIQKSSDPVMVIRPDMSNLPRAGWRPKKILIPLNGSPSAAAAMGRELDLAQQMDCDVDVVHIAVLGEEPPRETGTLTTPRYLDYPQHDWSAWAQEFMSRFAGRAYAHRIRLLHREGIPAAEMLRLAAESREDLIMLGWQGSLGQDRARTIKEILRETEVPIILIRTVPEVQTLRRTG